MKIRELNELSEDMIDCGWQRVDGRYHQVDGSDQDKLVRIVRTRVAEDD